MTQIADPHPGYEVVTVGPLVAGAVAHRRTVHEIPNVYTGRGTMTAYRTPPSTECSGEVGRSHSWSHSRHVGAILCTESACYPDTADA